MFSSLEIFLFPGKVSDTPEGSGLTTHYQTWIFFSEACVFHFNGADSLLQFRVGFVASLRKKTLKSQSFWILELQVRGSGTKGLGILSVVCILCSIDRLKGVPNRLYYVRRMKGSHLWSRKIAWGHIEGYRKKRCEAGPVRRIMAVNLGEIIVWSR